jgi:hypothetical protein
MATIRKEVQIHACADAVWDALRDVGALHTRLVPGFVVDTHLESGARVVTFANGAVAREQIVTIDNDERRLVWAILGGRFTHHNASAQVFELGTQRCRFVWIADFLPVEIAADIAAMMEHGIRTIEKTHSRADVAVASVVEGSGTRTAPSET